LLFCWNDVRAEEREESVRWRVGGTSTQVELLAFFSTKVHIIILLRAGANRRHSFPWRDRTDSHSVPAALAPRTPCRRESDIKGETLHRLGQWQSIEDANVCPAKRTPPFS
jgi:hypothetical protein